MIAMIKDQTRSKFIQKKIEEKSPQFFKLYEQIKNQILTIIIFTIIQCFIRINQFLSLK
jgi:hypothetical protein